MSGVAPAIGIDLGTTKSCVSVWLRGNVDVIYNDQGNRTTPSWVSFNNFERLVGETAKGQMLKNPVNTIFNVKRLIGRRYGDASVKKDMEQWPFYVIKENGKIKIKVEFKGEENKFTPEEITAMILRKMKEIAEDYLKQPVKFAVISAPAYFTDSQRQATKDAGRIAGLNILRIINEPTAAAIAYGIYRKLKDESNVLIFDLGGGTFDVSVVRINNGSIFEVKSTVGNTSLGGEDFDNRITEYFIKEFKKKFKVDITNAVMINRLRNAAELAKNTLTSSTKTIVQIDSFYEGLDFCTSITRSHFEKICEDLFSNIICLVKRVLNNAVLDKSSINDVVLVGCASRIPKIQTILKEFFDDIPISFSLNPDEAVAHGAAIQAAILSRIECPMLRNIHLVEITPLSLGIETSGNVMTKMIRRNTRIPCKRTQKFSTYEDNQLTVTIQVFEGERPMSYDNILLGTFNLTGIPPAPRGVPQIDVTFDIDNNGILNVTATENCTGNTQNIVIGNNRGQLSIQEVDKMLKDAEKYKKDDERQRKRIYARNELEGYIFNLKQTIKEDGEKLDTNDKDEIIQKCDTCLKWLDENVNITKEDLEYQLRDLQLDCSQILAKYNAPSQTNEESFVSYPDN